MAREPRAKPPKETDDGAREADEEAAEIEEAAGEPEPGRRRFALGGKKLLFGLPALLLLGGGAYYGATSYGLPGVAAPAAMSVKSKVYYDLPEMVVNLSSGDKRVQYLKLKVALEASDQQVIDALTPVMPRILDMFQLYLRELRSTDLEGSAGVFRLKEELLRRINIEVHPRHVDRVLFKEIIVQ